MRPVCSGRGAAGGAAGTRARGAAAAGVHGHERGDALRDEARSCERHVGEKQRVVGSTPGLTSAVLGITTTSCVDGRSADAAVAAASPLAPCGRLPLRLPWEARWCGRSPTVMPAGGQPAVGRATQGRQSTAAEHRGRAAAQSRGGRAAAEYRRRAAVESSGNAITGGPCAPASRVPTVSTVNSRCCTGPAYLRARGGCVNVQRAQRDGACVRARGMRACACTHSCPGMSRATCRYLAAGQSASGRGKGTSAVFVRT